MLSRDAFLASVWRELIDTWRRPQWIDRSIGEAERDPAAAFADAGAAAKRLVAAGGAADDVATIARSVAYETVFSLLYQLGDPGVDEDPREACLHEDLLGADPTGREGRPG